MDKLSRGLWTFMITKGSVLASSSYYGCTTDPDDGEYIMTTLTQPDMEFKVGHHYRTRDNLHIVRLICVDRAGACFQMIGLCRNSYGEENIMRFQSSGHYLMTKDEFRHDLVWEIEA